MRCDEAGALASIARDIQVADTVPTLDPRPPCHQARQREILEPLVIAGLLGFIVAPLIRALRGWGLWRVPSVLLTVILAIAVLAGLGSTIVLQVTQLAEDLPKYENNLRGTDSSALERASGTLKDLQAEITKSGSSPHDGPKPLLVEVRQPEAKGLESMPTLCGRCFRRWRRQHSPSSS